MKRFFILFSIIMLLGSNFAMAVDFDCQVVNDDVSTLSQDQNTDPDSKTSVDNGCHSVSHLVAIYPSNIIKSSMQSTAFVIIPISVPTSTSYQPATPPPNV